MPVRSQTRRGELGPMANGVAKGANNLGGTAAPLANLDQPQSLSRLDEPILPVGVGFF